MIEEIFIFNHQNQLINCVHLFYKKNCNHQYIVDSCIQIDWFMFIWWCSIESSNLFSSVISSSIQDAYKLFTRHTIFMLTKIWCITFHEGFNLIWINLIDIGSNLFLWWYCFFIIVLIMIIILFINSSMYCLLWFPCIILLIV